MNNEYKHESRVGIVDVQSKWKKQSVPKDRSTQTSVEHAEAVIQTKATSLAAKKVEKDLSDVECQVDDEELLKSILPGYKIDATSVLSFLKSVLPLMEQQLDQNVASHAFDDFDVNWNDEVETVQCLYNFTLPQTILNKYQIPLSCTDISWSSSGKTLAATYGRINVTGWCLESGYVAIFSVPIAEEIAKDKRSSSTSITKTLSHVIEIEESYAMKVSFHPKMDNVLAVGTYDGGIRIHKLEKETDSLIAASRIEQYSHRDPITALHWLKNQVDNSYVLASMSSDGLVLWWSAKNRLEKPIAMYKFTDLERGAPLGATALSFLNKFAGSSVKNKGAPTTDNSFIIGTEVGQIVKSSFSQVERFNTTKQDFFKQKVEVINSTLDFTYDSTTGYTHCVESSPFRRDVFLTASSDGLVRLYNSFKQKDMVTLQPERGSSINTGFAYDARWSPFRPLVVGIGTDTGKLLLYDLSESIANPVVAIDNHTEKEVKASTTMTSSLHGRSIYCVRFNQASRELLATGGQTGVVKVWLLNDELTQTQKKEQEKLAQLFQ